MTINAPDWLRAAQADRNAELRATGMCESGSSISDHPRPAEYVVTYRIGNEIPLCAYCVALTRELAEAGEIEQPVKIESLEVR